MLYNQSKLTVFQKLTSFWSDIVRRSLQAGQTRRSGWTVPTWKSRLDTTSFKRRSSSNPTRGTRSRSVRCSSRTVRPNGAPSPPPKRAKREVPTSPRWKRKEPETSSSSSGGNRSTDATSQWQSLITRQRVDLRSLGDSIRFDFGHSVSLSNPGRVF